MCYLCKESKGTLQLFAFCPNSLNTLNKHAAKVLWNRRGMPKHRHSWHSSCHSRDRKEAQELKAGAEQRDCRTDDVRVNRLQFFAIVR